MTYWTQFWRWTSSFNSFPLRLDTWLLPLPVGWKLSFGIWIRFTVDSPGAPPSMALNGEGTSYRHMAIDERQGDIRLLKLHPGNPGDTIRTSLVASYLSNNPYFEAIPYVWGSHLQKAEILVDGQRFYVTQNLYDALHDLRNPDSEMTFWTDQVCIDQCNGVEKNDQVAKMGQIYGAASNVIVYLGRQTEQTEIDMHCLRFFIEPHVRGQQPPWSHIAITDIEQGIRNILANPWFERIWTVQEFVLARRTTLQYGRYRMGWVSDLQTLAALIFRIKSTVISPLYNLSERDTRNLDWSPLLPILEAQMRQAARREGVFLHRNFVDLAYDFRHRVSTDPRDMFYAIMGIIENDQGGLLRVHGGYNLSLEDVYQQFREEVQRVGETVDQSLERDWDVVPR